MPLISPDPNEFPTCFDRPKRLESGQQLTIRYHRLINFNTTFTWAWMRYNCPRCKIEEMNFVPEHGYYVHWNWDVLPWDYNLKPANQMNETDFNSIKVDYL